MTALNKGPARSSQTTVPVDEKVLNEAFLDDEKEKDCNNGQGYQGCRVSAVYHSVINLEHVEGADEGQQINEKAENDPGRKSTFGCVKGTGRELNSAFCACVRISLFAQSAAFTGF